MIFIVSSLMSGGGVVYSILSDFGDEIILRGKECNDPYFYNLIIFKYRII